MNFYSGLCKSFAHNQSLLQLFQVANYKPKFSTIELSNGATNYVSIVLIDDHSCLAKISVAVDIS
jgi:hypothetical protein